MYNITDSDYNLASHLVIPILSGVIILVSCVCVYCYNDIDRDRSYINEETSKLYVNTAFVYD